MISPEEVHVKRNRSKALLLPVLAVGIASLSPALIKGQEPREGACRPDPELAALSPNELAAMGMRTRNEILAEAGHHPDPNLQRRVLEVLRNLEQAIGDPSLDLTIDVLAGDDFQAAVIPGGFVVVGGGTVRTLEYLAQQEQAARPSARADAMLAAILAHELAHHSLGHLARDRPDQTAGERADRRACEADADGVGALYLLRAGMEIQTAMDVFTGLDWLSRQNEGAFYSLQNTTYLRTHPRLSERVANLEVLRGELHRYQRRLDDAIALTRHGVELDAAIALLDRVLQVFPDLPAALHAKATAHHVRWLQIVPVQQQQVRTALVVPGSTYILGIRGSEAEELLSDARAGYGAVLRREFFAPSVAHLALLDAYAGDEDRALDRAQRASTAMPDDPGILNNRGIVHFLRNELDLARRDFQAAFQASEGSSLVAMFNLGRTLHALGQPAADPLLGRYAMIDTVSAWGLLARDLLEGRNPRGSDASRARGAGAVQPGTPGPPEDPPSLGTIALGEPVSFIVERLGSPPEAEDRFWHYPEQGVRLATSEDGRATLVLLSDSRAGEFRGVSVGMNVGAVLQEWGDPDLRNGDLWIWHEGTWIRSIRTDGESVLEIGIGTT